MQSERETWKGSVQEEPARVEATKEDWRINMIVLACSC